MTHYFELKCFNNIKSKEIDCGTRMFHTKRLRLYKAVTVRGRQPMLLSSISLLSKDEPLPILTKNTTAVFIYQNEAVDTSDTITPKLEIHKANDNGYPNVILH